MDERVRVPAGEDAAAALQSMEIEASAVKDALRLASPIDESLMPGVRSSSVQDVQTAIGSARDAFLAWRTVPAPVRGELVRLFGQKLREHKSALGRLVTLEVGKPISEGMGEVQEMIDICDFAVGLSRQLYGLTMASERADHHMREAWYPVGPVGIISAFNFPVAVWAWNAALALVCGDSILWKPSEKAPLTAFAAHELLLATIRDFAAAPPGLSALLIGDAQAGRTLVDDPRVPLISATGSTRMGRSIGMAVAARFGRSLLELGGNAATIVTPSADIGLALRAITFGATGTAGQRCTTMRRLLVHEDVYEQLIPALKRAYAKLEIGDPRSPGTHAGPLIDNAACEVMEATLREVRDSGGLAFGGARLPGPGYYAKPALVDAGSDGSGAARDVCANPLCV